MHTPHVGAINNKHIIFSQTFHTPGSQSMQSIVRWKYQRQTVSRGFLLKTKLDDKNLIFLQVLESAGVEPNDREVSKLERMADESGDCLLYTSDAADE